MRERGRDRHLRGGGKGWCRRGYDRSRWSETYSLCCAMSWVRRKRVRYRGSRERSVWNSDGDWVRKRDILGGKGRGRVKDSTGVGREKPRLRVSYLATRKVMPTLSLRYATSHSNL